MTVNPNLNPCPIAIRLTLPLALQDGLRTLGYSIGQFVCSKVAVSQDGWKIIPGIKGKVLGVDHGDDEKVLVEFNGVEFDDEVLAILTSTP